jgi:hypothetical protein
MDPREIKVFGLIEELNVRLVVYMGISILMDIIVINFMNDSGMLFSRKWDTNLGGSFQTDLSYATIPTCKGTYVNSYHEQLKIFCVEDPNEPMN